MSSWVSFYRNPKLDVEASAQNDCITYALQGLRAGIVFRIPVSIALWIRAAEERRRERKEREEERQVIAWRAKQEE